jgi:DnaD/phage-associated family protein
MTIIRVNKDARYFTASNEPFNDKRLHWETRGLLAYLLSKPNTWTVRLSDLEAQGPAKITKLRKMLKDAQKHGYMNRVRIVRKDGTFYWITEIYESPNLNPLPQSSGRFSTSGLSTCGKPTDIVITEEVITEATTRVNVPELYEQNIGVLTPLIANAITDAEQTYPMQWIADAITLSVTNNKRNWKYVEAILKRWKADGKDDGSKPPAKRNGRSQAGETALERYAKQQGA